MNAQPNIQFPISKAMAGEEFTVSDIRQILQQLFPHRRLVLSQFTFFHQIGVAKPTGESFCRGRRCYLLEDILSIACVLALKEEGIPMKNREVIPELVQQNASAIFEFHKTFRLAGVGANISISSDGAPESFSPVDALLSGAGEIALFWSYDVSALARQLQDIVVEKVGRRQIAA